MPNSNSQVQVWGVLDTKMNKMLITTLCLSFLIIGFASSQLMNSHKESYGVEVDDNTVDKVTIYNFSQDYLTKNCENNILDKISIIAEQVADSHEYKLNVYDCTQFSEELVNRLNESGYGSYCVAGYLWELDDQGHKFKKKYHTWVEVNTSYGVIPVEATRGYIIDSQTYINDYHIYWRGGKCW